MRVFELIEWLQTQPQDAIVEVVMHRRGTSYYEQGGWASTQEFKAEVKTSKCDGYAYSFPVDYELNEHKGVKTLTLGTMDN